MGKKKNHQKKGERKIICLLRVWHPAYIKKSCNSTVETNNSIKNGQRRRTRRLTLHDFKTQYEATGIETASYWWRSTQNNGTEQSPEPPVQRDATELWQRIKSNERDKGQSSQQRVLEQLDTHTPEEQADVDLTFFAKNHSKLTRPKCEIRNYKVPKGNTGGNLGDLMMII